MEWIKETFGTLKPIVAMCHFKALPGDPYYDSDGGMQKVIDFARKDFLALQNGKVDAVMFSNEFSMPYLTKVRPETTVAMARIIGELMSEIKIPFGVNVLWDPIASIDLAAATGGRFIREIMSGVYSSDFGVWDTDVGKTARHKVHVSQQNLKMMFNIVPEAAKYLGDRDIAEVAKSTVFNCMPDILCVSGLTAGVETNFDTLSTVKNAVPNTPVFANTGCRVDNIKQQLSIADGAVVGSTFKYNGIFENAVDQTRVERFMEEVYKNR